MHVVANLMLHVQELIGCQSIAVESYILPLPATSFSTKQLCLGDDRSYTYISRMGYPQDVCWSSSKAQAGLGLGTKHTGS